MNCALDPASGKEVWTCKWLGNRYPALVAGDGLVFATGNGGESLAIDPTGVGDVTKTHVKWHAKAQEGFGSPALEGGYLYRASPTGIVRCWKASDGALVFEERVEGIPSFSSPVATKDGRLYFASAGKSCVLKAGPVLEVLATNDLGEGERNEWTLTGPSAAVAGGAIFSGGLVRNSVIGRNARVHAGALVEESILLDNCDIGRRARIRRAILDQNVRVPEDACIGYDLDHDRQFHHVTDSGIVVVEGNRTPVEIGDLAV